MTRHEFEAALELFLKLSTPGARPYELVFFGGEPTLAWDAMADFLKMARERLTRIGEALRVALVTNGSALSDERADFLLREGVFVVLSLDGRELANDEGRGSGTYAQGIAALDRLRDRSVDFGISVTVGKHNAASLADDIEWLVERYRPRDLGLNPYLHGVLGRGKNPYQIGEDSVDSILAAYERLMEKDLFMEQPMRRIRPIIQEVPRLKDCPACGGKVVVGPGGRVAPCEYFLMNGRESYAGPEYAGLADRIEEHWRRMAPVRWEECRSCPCVGVCGGGCRYDTYNETGAWRSMPEYRCRIERRVLSWILGRIARLKPESTELWIPSREERSRIVPHLPVNAEELPIQSSSRFGERE